jgi:aminomethyltransferase
MKSIPLASLHQELGAKFGPFAGYQMPIQYPAGLKAEHLHTRSHAGLFDVSHMGQLRVTAPNDASGATSKKSLERALPCDFEGWTSDTQRYSLLLNQEGGINDDLMLVWREADVSQGRPIAEVRMVVNAGNRDADLAQLKTLCPDLQFDWVDAALIALQGPDAESVLAALDPKAADMVFMEAADLTLCGATCFTTRSGYTGEDGYEISIPAALAEKVTRALLADARVNPVGLGARDTLRLEAGLPLHGQDISPTISPIEAGLGFGIAPSRRPAKSSSHSGTAGEQAASPKLGNFPGAKPILEQIRQGSPRKLIGLTSKEPVPIRAHAVIVDAKGDPVGEVTSGTVSPSLGHPIMLALVQSQAVDLPLFARVRDKTLAVERTRLPFVPKRYKR